MKDILITSLETITAFDVVTGAYKFTLDELQSASIAQTEEKTDLTGKGGRKLSSLKRNKAVTISGNNGIVSGGLLELQTGGKFENKATEVMWTDAGLSVNGSHKATTSFTAVGATGKEIAGLYIRNNDGTLGAALEQVASAGSVASGKFAYDPSTKEITLYSDVEEGKELVAYYNRNITADVLDNKSDNYSGKCTLYIDAIGEDKCANIYHLQFFIPKADFNGEFTFEMGDNQTVQAFEAEALSGACGAGGTLWTYTVFGDEEDDVRVLESISVTTAPTDTTYSVGETFDPAGMVVKATYSDSDTPVTLNTGSYTYTPNGALEETDTAIYISYTENGVTKTTSTPITVS